MGSAFETTTPRKRRDFCTQIGFATTAQVVAACRANLAYVEQQLVPTLRPGDIAVMLAGVCKAIERAGARVVYLPPYSPDFNPVEMVFSKLKALARRAAPRTMDALWNLLGALLDAFSADECHRYLRHCGYAATASREPL